MGLAQPEKWSRRQLRNLSTLAIKSSRPAGLNISGAAFDVADVQRHPKLEFRRLSAQVPGDLQQTFLVELPLIEMA